MKKVRVSSSGKNWDFVIDDNNGVLSINNNGSNYPVDLKQLGHGRYSLILDGHSYEFGINGANDGYTIFHGSSSGQFTVEDYEIARIKKEAGIEDSAMDKRIIAPMPGLIVSIVCTEGVAVSQGQPLLVMEAMKMENDIKSPVSATVRKIAVSNGDSVNKGQLLIEFE